MLAAPDQQISLTDPDSRSMATSRRGSGVLGVQRTGGGRDGAPPVCGARSNEYGKVRSDARSRRAKLAKRIITPTPGFAPDPRRMQQTRLHAAASRVRRRPAACPELVP
jgi:hypothetical protein